MSTATAFTDSMADNEASAHPENLRATDIKALLRDFIDSIPEEKLLRLREGCSYSPIYHDGNFGLLKRWKRSIVEVCILHIQVVRNPDSVLLRETPLLKLVDPVTVDCADPMTPDQIRAAFREDPFLWSDKEM